MDFGAAHATALISKLSVQENWQWNKLSHPSFTRATLPDMCGSSGSGLTVTSMSLTYFQAESGLIRALSCSFVPIGTAWSTGSSLFERLLIRDAGASLYRATSYSKRPGVSSTTPDTRAPWGLKGFRNLYTVA